MMEKRRKRNRKKEENDGKKEERNQKRKRESSNERKKKRKRRRNSRDEAESKEEESINAPPIAFALSPFLPSFFLREGKRGRKPLSLTHSLLLPRANTPRGFFSLSSSFLKVCFVTIFFVFQFSSLKNFQQVLMMM